MEYTSVPPEQTEAEPEIEAGCAGTDCGKTLIV
jgi:hypothetical protein